MPDLKKLETIVQQNCHISDAHFAGHYTLCVFLLKMREYFRWEKRIPLSHSLPKESLGEWMVQREQAWNAIEEQNYSPLEIDGERFDPFDTESINRRLTPHGYVYSGGYGLFHKPCFFLARLTRVETRHDTTLFIAAEEIARDIMAPPAMLLGRHIFIRQESLRRFIWEKIEEWGFKQQEETPMARALACYPQDDPEHMLDLMANNELESLILHESGEAEAHQLLGAEWEMLLDALPRSQAELIARAVRDNLADCLSTLPALIAAQNNAALHFYFANFSGMRRELFPEAMAAYRQWLETGRTDMLSATCRQGAERWLALARQILDLYRQGANPLGTAIEQLCLAS